mgnify:CR=1 FL=1
MRKAKKENPNNFLYEAKPWDYAHWNENLRYSKTYGSCLTDTSFIAENAEGKMVRLEVAHIIFAKKGSDGIRDTGDNMVTLRYFGGTSEFTYREEDLHKQIKRFV